MLTEVRLQGGGPPIALGPGRNDIAGGDAVRQALAAAGAVVVLPEDARRALARPAWSRYRALEGEVEDRYARYRREDLDAWTRAEEALKAPSAPAEDWKEWEKKWQAATLSAARAEERKREADEAAQRRPKAQIMSILLSIVMAATVLWAIFTGWWGSFAAALLPGIVMAVYIGRVREAWFYGQLWQQAREQLTRTLADWGLRDVSPDQPGTAYQVLRDMYEPEKKRRAAARPDAAPRMSPEEAAVAIEKARAASGLAERAELERRVLKREELEAEMRTLVSRVGALLSSADPLVWRERMADLRGTSLEAALTGPPGTLVMDAGFRGWPDDARAAAEAALAALAGQGWQIVCLSASAGR